MNRAKALDLLPGFVTAVDRDLRITTAAGAGFDSLPYAAEDLIGRRLADVFAERSPKGTSPIEYFERALEGEGAVYEVPSVRGHWYRTRVEPLREDGDIVGAIALTLDVTEHHELQASLGASERRFRRFVEQVPLVTYMSRVDGGMPLYVSPQIEAVLGYTVDEWLSDPSLTQRVVHPEDLDRATRCVSEGSDSHSSTV